MLHIIMCCNQMLALMITIQYYALGLIIITHHLITASSLHICISSISLSFVLSMEHFLSDLRFSQQWLGRLLLSFGIQWFADCYRGTITLEECPACTFRVHFWSNDGGSRSLTLAHTYQLHHITFQKKVIFRTNFILTWLQDKTINSNGFHCNFRIASRYLSVLVLGVIQ